MQPASRAAPSKAQIAVWSALLLAVAVLSLWDYASFQVGVYVDDSIYVILARSLIQPGRYGLINAPGGPTGAAPFPIGYPLVLAPCAFLFPNALDAMKLVSLAATLLNVTLLFWGWPWYSRRSRWWGLGVTGLYALAPLTVEHTRMVMSEAVFTTACLAAMLLVEHAVQGSRRRWWNWALIGAALIFALLVRTIGVVLIASAAGYGLWVGGKRFWKPLAVMVMAILVLGLAVAVTPVELDTLFPTRYLREHNASLLLGLYGNLVTDPALAGAGQPGMDYWLNVLLERSSRHLFQDVRLTVLPLGGGASEQALADRIGLPFLPAAVGVMVLGLVALGYWRWLTRAGPTVFNLFPLFYFGALLLWNWNGSRLLYPIQPQLYLGLLMGIETILTGAAALGRWRGRATSALLAAGALALLALSAYQSLTLEDSRLHISDLEARTRWLKLNSPPSAVIMTEQPFVDYVHSGRKTVGQPAVSNLANEQAEYPVLTLGPGASGENTSPSHPGAPGSPEQLAGFLERRGVDYILVAPQLAWQASFVPTYSDDTQRLLPLIYKLVSAGRLELVYASEQDGIKVFQVLPAP